MISCSRVPKNQEVLKLLPLTQKQMTRFLKKFEQETKQLLKNKSNGPIHKANKI
jgi:hypothetical protein